MDRKMQMTDSEKLGPYITDRSKHWRSHDLNQTFLNTLGHIEKFGCAVLHIKGDAASPRFSYTVGVHDTSKNPEIIAIGLTADAAHGALNRTVALMKSGENLTIGRHRGIVGEVECEFRLVDPKWMHHVMGRADWYYEGVEIPVLQLIYPDLENRFQTEDGFSEYFRQPILTAGAERGRLEDDFWAANDLSSSLSRWKFLMTRIRRHTFQRPSTKRRSQ